MAAIAGSKGRVRVSEAMRRPSFQAEVASAVLSGRWTPEEAAEQIVSQRQLREVGIDTNMLCNLRCKYCYLDDRLPEQGQLTPEDWMGRLTPLAHAGAKLFAFIGKEPLLDDTAIETLGRLDQFRRSGLRFRTGMVTNGTRLDRYVDRLPGVNLSYLDVSLDGLTEFNDAWRGEGTSELVIRNLRLFLRTNPSHDLFVACVLHQGNREHVCDFASFLFDLGVPGLFLSPVLKFTKNDTIEHWSISGHELEETIDALLSLAKNRRSRHFQILIDLPYRYAWWLLSQGGVPSDAVHEDEYEVPYYQPDPSLPVYIKMNFLSFSYWRAVRITHDGTPVLSMDLAAHPRYQLGNSGTSHWTPTVWEQDAGRRFHRRFCEEHSSLVPSELFDRDIPGQLNGANTTPLSLAGVAVA